MRLTVLYISGPMSGRPGYNYPAFREAERQLVAAGFVVVSPRQRLIEGKTHDEYLAFDLQQMEVAHDVYAVNVGARCGVALLPGWENSKGVAQELERARGYGWECKTVEDWIEEATT